MKRSIKLTVTAFIFCFATITAAQAQGFVEVTNELGLTGTPSFYISVADLNGDDYPDIFAHDITDSANWDVMNKMYIFLNVEGPTPGTRQFVDFTAASGIHANRRGTTDGRHSDLAVFGDVDNDGDLDYFAGMYYHRHTYIPEDIDWIDYNDLFLNDGKGHFTLAEDTTFFDAGLTNVSSAVFADFDRDGFLDLFVGNWFTEYYGGTVDDIFAPELLYRGNGDATFLDVSASSGIQAPEVLQPTYGAAVADVDGDGYPDIFLGNYCRDKSKHLHNNGDWTFTEIHETSNFGFYVGPGNCTGTCSWGSMPRDFDNDGDIDMFTILTHGCKKVLSAPLINDGTGVFEWNFDCILSRLDYDPMKMHHGDHYATWVDWNNDTLVDVLLSECGYENNRFYIFRHEPDHTLQVITPSTAMMTLNTEDEPVHNASAFDYDLDGDDDLIIGSSGDYPIRVFRNDEGNLKHHLAVTLVGAGKEGFSNASAIGAKIQVTTGSTTVTRVVRAGDGHFSPQVPLRLNFGMATSTTADQVAIIWPNLAQDVYNLYQVPADTHIRIYENPDPIASGNGMRIFIPNDDVKPDERFSVWGYLYNDSTAVMDDVPVMVLLGIEGMYWFWDGWTNSVDFALMDVKPGVTVFPIFPEFIWPDTGTASADGLMVYGAMLNSSMTEIVGGIDGLAMSEFGFGP